MNDEVLRRRAERDLALCRRRLAQLEAMGPQPTDLTLGDVLNYIAAERRSERRSARRHLRLVVANSPTQPKGTTA